MGAGGFKIFTHDFRPPIQGGNPVWAPNLGLPYELPTVRLDTSEAECAAGWNYVTDLAEGFRIAGLWSHGRAAAVFAVEPSADGIGGTPGSAGFRAIAVADAA